MVGPRGGSRAPRAPRAMARAPHAGPRRARRTAAHRGDRGDPDGPWLSPSDIAGVPHRRLLVDRPDAAGAGGRRRAPGAHPGPVASPGERVVAPALDAGADG